MRAKISSVIRLTVACTLLTISASTQQPEGFTVRDFLRRTYFQEIEASPDSKHVAVLTTKYNYGNDKKEWALWNLRATESAGASAPTRIAVANGPISAITWSPDARYLAFKIAQNIDAPARLSVFDVSTAKILQLTDEKTSKNGVSALSWSSNGRDLFFAVDDTPTLPKGSPVTFPRRTEPNPNATFFRIATSEIAKAAPKVFFSLDFQIPLEFVVLPGENSIIYRPGIALFRIDISDPKSRKRITPWLGCMLGLRAVAKGLLFQACAGVPDGKLDLNANSIRTQRRQYLLDPISGNLEQLAVDYQGELWSRGVTHTGELLAIGLESTKWTLYQLDPSTKNRTVIRTPATGVSHISVGGNGKLAAFASITDGEIYLANGLGSLVQAQKVTDFNAAYNSQPRSETRTIRWSNGTGGEVEGVVYFPPGKTDAKGLPAVVAIHGGPWMARSEPYYAPLAGGPVDDGVMLASKGYLVLAPNYRGSTGRGDAFLSAIDGYPCSRPATDVLAGVEMIVAKGWADPDRLGVWGGSYGGFTTNCVLGRTTRFKAAVTAASGWNLTSSFSDSPGSFGVPMLRTPWDDSRFWEESPISKAGNIKTPTLIIHGEADPQVSVSQAREMSRALNRMRVPNELLIFPGEGHGFSIPSNDITRWEAKIAWFDHYLLGKPFSQEK